MINPYAIYVEMYSAQNYEINVQIFSGYLKEVYSNLNILEKSHCTFVAGGLSLFKVLLYPI